MGDDVEWEGGSAFKGVGHYYCPGTIISNIPMRSETGSRFEEVWPHHGAIDCSHCSKVMADHTCHLFVTQGIDQYHSISDQDREFEGVQVD